MTTVDRRTEDGIAALELQSGKTNTLTTTVVHDLAEALAQAAPERAIILSGGDRFFSNGLDLGWALGVTRSELREFFLSLGRTIDLMLTLPIPIIGCLRGHAIGAGKTLFVACDHRVAASGRVLIGAPEVKLGVPNPLFADWLLRLVAGDAVANSLLYHGTLARAESLTTCGMVQEVAAPGDLGRVTRAAAESLAALPKGAFAASKVMRSRRLCRELADHLPPQIDVLLDHWFGHEAQVLLRAAAARKE